MTHFKLQGIYEQRKGKRTVLFTRNLTPGKTVYDEKLVREGKIEYREWNSRRSKLAAFLMKGGNQIGIKDGYTVLYLGASYGTTASHVCEERKNMAPLFFDANRPEKYKDRVKIPVDVVYMDIAQRSQAEIFLKNVEMFLKPEGFCLLAVKSRSIDVTKKPGVIFKEVRRKLEEKLIIVDYKTLEPFELDHCMFVCKKR